MLLMEVRWPSGIEAGLMNPRTPRNVSVELWQPSPGLISLDAPKLSRRDGGDYVPTIESFARPALQEASDMANTEWWQRGPVDGVPPILQPVAHILLQVRESVDELADGLTESEWNARPGGIASAAFHVRHITGVVDRLFTYARGDGLSETQFAALRAEGEHLAAADVPATLDALHVRIEAAVAELRTVDVTTLGDFRGVGRARLPSTVIGCLVHAAEHSMRHVGQLSVTARVVRSATA
jgi:hypothetical protein